MSRFKKLSHVLGRCQDHNVWVPKYRHRILTGEVGQEEKNCKSGCKKVVLFEIGKYRIPDAGGQIPDAGC